MFQLWQLAVEVKADEAETLSDFIAASALSLSINLDDSKAAEIVAFFDEKPTDDYLTVIAAMAGTIPACHIADDSWRATTSRADGAGQVAGFNLVDKPSDATRLVIRHELSILSPKAFGDGYHATTQGCLSALSWVHRRQSRLPRIADIGCGTGVLALAAHKLWPSVRIVASDIDPLSIAATRQNARDNAFRQLPVFCGPGFVPPLCRARPFDLLLMNILARPLTQLSTIAARNTAPGGYLILSGMLESQVRLVLAAFRRQRLALIRQSVQDGWVTLILRKRA